MATRKKRAKISKMDGLGPYEKKRLRNAIRQVWQRCFARSLVLKRCVDKDGFSCCEKCKKRVPKVYVDHTKPVGELDAGFIERLFVPSNQMQGLCKKCHQPKTNAENAERRRVKKLAEAPDF